MTKATINSPVRVNKHPVIKQGSAPEKEDPEHTLGYKGVQSLALMHVRTIPSAINEWIDNARDADAEKVEVLITETKKYKYVDQIIIRDNGHGMDYDELFGAFEIGHDRNYKPNSIGKFGLGGTMSSLSLFNNKIILTKTLGGSIVGRYYDMGLVKSLGKWKTFPLAWAQIQDDYPEHVEFLDNLSHGTVIIHYNPTANKLYSNAINATKSQVGETFSSDLKSGYFGVTVNDTPVKPRCALGSDSEGAIIKPAQDLIIGGRKVGKVTCMSLRDAKLGPRTKGNVLIQHAGFYFVRVDRLITKAVWPGDSSGMFPKNGNFARGTLHPDNRYVRIKVEFNSSEDSLFGVRATKDSVLLDQSLADVISSLTSDFVSQDAAQVGGRTKKKNAEGFHDSAMATLDKVKASVHAAPKKKLRTRNATKEPALSVVKREVSSKAKAIPADWLRGGVELSDLGFESALSVYRPEDAVLKFNKQHPSLPRITDLTDTPEKVLTEIFISLHSARLETAARLDDYCETTMTQFLQTLDQKFRAIIRD